MTWWLVACATEADRGARTLLDVQGGEDSAVVSEVEALHQQVPLVAIASPGEGAVLQNPVTFALDAEDVTGFRLDADGWVLGSWEGTGSPELTHTFSGVGYPRVIALEGYADGGAVVARDEVTITVEPPASGSLDVPYYLQYDNAYEPSGTCGVTSAAMVLSHFGASVTPDQLYLAHGKAQAQSPGGLQALYGWYGLYGKSGYSATRADLKGHLDAGRPVVVHGSWTSAGHIAVLVGYDASGWIVHDPAGDWYVGYGGTSWGEAVHYPFDGSWDAAMSWDGDVWWSAAAPSSF